MVLFWCNGNLISELCVISEVGRMMMMMIEWSLEFFLETNFIWFVVEWPIDDDDDYILLLRQTVCVYVVVEMELLVWF